MTLRQLLCRQFPTRTIAPRAMPIQNNCSQTRPIWLNYSSEITLWTISIPDKWSRTRTTEKPSPRIIANRITTKTILFYNLNLLWIWYLKRFILWIIFQFCPSRESPREGLNAIISVKFGHLHSTASKP